MQHLVQASQARAGTVAVGSKADVAMQAPEVVIRGLLAAIRQPEQQQHSPRTVVCIHQCHLHTCKQECSSVILQLQPPLGFPQGSKTDHAEVLPTTHSADRPIRSSKTFLTVTTLTIHLHWRVEWQWLD